MECTVETDEHGRLKQRQNFGETDSFSFDPRDVFKGDGGGIGGRGRGLGDGTTHPEPTGNASLDGDDKGDRGYDSVDPERYLEHERR